VIKGLALQRPDEDCPRAAFVRWPKLGFGLGQQKRFIYGINVGARPKRISLPLVIFGHAKRAFAILTPVTFKSGTDGESVKLDWHELRLPKAATTAPSF